MLVYLESLQVLRYGTLFQVIFHTFLSRFVDRFSFFRSLESNLGPPGLNSSMTKGGFFGPRVGPSEKIIGDVVLLSFFVVLPSLKLTVRT